MPEVPAGGDVMAWRCSVCEKVVEQGVRNCPNGCNPLDGLAQIFGALKTPPKPKRRPRVHAVIVAANGSMLYCGPVICGGGKGSKRPEKVTCPRCRAKLKEASGGLRQG